jgi:hypothetical protein
MLSDYLEHFKMWARKQGAETADWDDLFKRSIEEDWARIAS